MPSDGKSSLCLWQGELKMWDFDDFENNVPSSRKRQHRVIGNVNINQLAIMLGLVSGFCLLNIFIYIYIVRQSINGDDYLSGAAQTDKKNLKRVQII